MRQGVVFSIIAVLAVSCIADTLVVDLNGTGDYLTIQSAIDVAQDGDTVLVRDGIYTGDGNRDVDFLGKGITVQSENGPETCTVDCQGTEEYPHRAFTFQNGETHDSILSGFKIINGYGLEETIGLPESGNYASTTSGGGVFSEGASPMILNCIFENCIGENGGAMYFSSGSPVISNTIFKNNFGGSAAILSNECSITITNCRFIANDSMHRTVTLIVSYSEMITIEGPGPIALFRGVADIANCIFSGNMGYASSGVTILDTETSIRNCTFVGNRSQHYTAIYGHDSFFGSLEDFTINQLFSVNNCIFQENQSLNNNGQIGVFGIFIEPEGSLIFEFSPIYEINYSNVEALEPNLPGFSNIEADSLFADPGYWDSNGTLDDWGDDVWIEGDYHLQKDSPCIDAGDPNYIPLPSETDLDGNARLMGSAVDMGCYEFLPLIEAIEVEAKLMPQSLNRKSNRPHVIGRLELMGYDAADLDPDESMVLMPGNIAAERVEILPGKKKGDSIKLMGFFDHALVMEAIAEDGDVEVTLAAKLLTGQWIFGTDVVTVK